MQQVLEIGGHQVWTAHSGSEALSIVMKHGSNLGLLLTDVLMPGMSGPALAEAARRSLPELPVLYVSGYFGDYGDRLPEGSYLEKPFTASQLLERVQALIVPTARNEHARCCPAI
jgi:CheY-like chemotaxis protein